MPEIGPQHFECDASDLDYKIHRWIRQVDGGARCLNCKVVLTRAQAEDVFRDSSKPRYR